MMRRLPALIIILLILTVAFAQAGSGNAWSSNPDRPPVVLQHDISGAWKSLVVEEAINGPQLSDGNPAADICDNAPDITFPFGGTTTTNLKTEGAEDQPLACAWGNPIRQEGKRTVWYKFTAGETSKVTIDTIGSTFDTILAVYRASNGGDNCNALVQIACDDDSHFFSSRITIGVRAGETYYIEVADWQFAPNDELTLAVSAWTSELDTNWQIANSEVQVSRHVALPVGEKVYVIGGQTTVKEFPVRTSRTRAYDTRSGFWTELAAMPGIDPYGYSNTTAVLLSDPTDKIYVPSGYIGDPLVYDGTHYVYDVDSNTWDTAAANIWSGGVPAIYSGAAPGTTSLVDNGYYLSGGLTGYLPDEDDATLNWSARDELYYYSVELDTWFLFESMKTGRFGHAAAQQFIGGDEHHCVAGGIGRDIISSEPAVLRSVECFDVQGGNWTDVAQLNYPRYFAGSAVDPDGNWVIFGGVGENGSNIGPVERYDPDANQWIVLDINHDLTKPALSWPRGGFIGSTLWIIGGEDNGSKVVNLVQNMKVLLPAQDGSLFLPLVLANHQSELPGSIFTQALVLNLNAGHAQSFSNALDDVDVYAFDLPSSRQIEVELTGIPLGSNYNVFVYSHNKLYLTPYDGLSPGNLDERFSLSLPAGRYYIVVQRVLPVRGIAPNTQPYTIKVKG